MDIKFPVLSSSDYKDKCSPLMTDNDASIIDRIITLEVAICIVRQTAGGYGFYVDTLSDELDKVIAEYEDESGKVYAEPNKDFIWS